MRVVLRADAGSAGGTGHVMRLLTLSEELRRRGHDVRLATAEIDVPWLAEHLAVTGIPLLPAVRDRLDPDVLDDRPDWVVVDSYRIPPADIAALRPAARVLALVDGETRGIDADLVIDTNLGAEATGEAMLRGAGYALIRDAILLSRRDEPWMLASSPARVLAFLGGSDPTSAGIDVARGLADVRGIRITMVAPPHLHTGLRAILGAEAEILDPTPELPALLAATDLVVAAAGTSAWDVCALGIPAVLIGVVGNQSASIAAAAEARVALTIDAVAANGSLAPSVAGFVDALVQDQELRRELSHAARTAIDGRGKVRIVDLMEQQ